MSHANGLYCRNCKLVIPESKFRMTCTNCGNPLEVSYDLKKIKTALSNRVELSNSVSALLFWRDILPIDRPELIERVSIGETQTPLVKSLKIGQEMGVDDLRFKIEMGPTLSLKDRGSSLCALKALELGYDKLCVASSGNNAASVAAYGAKAGVPAVVFIQKDTSPAKVFKILVYGAQVVRVDGDMSVASKLCNDMLQRYRWFQCGGPNPYRLTAKRTVAYEIVYQLGVKAPDAVFIPCGGAAGMVAAYNGFSEMMEMGLIQTMPRIIGVQLSACEPITRAYQESRDHVEPVEKKPSFSDALLNNTPFWGDRALMIARKTDGLFLSVSDKEVAGTIRLLGSQEGLFVEPAGAVSVAGLRKVFAEKRIERIESAVCMLTGHGLNAPQAVFDPRLMPEIIEPEVEAVESFLNL